MKRVTLFGAALLTALGVAAARAQEKAGGLEGIVAAGARPELVEAGFVFTEGPVRAPDGGLYFSDVRANRIYRIGGDIKGKIVRENTNGANGLAFDRQGRLIAAQGGAARIVAFETRGEKALATQYQGKPFNRPNDLILDRKGGIYFTDPGARPMPGQPAPAGKPSVYYVRPGGEVILVSDEVPRPNGITLTLDEKTLLVANSQGEEVIAFDVQPDGSAKNRRVFARLRDIPAGQASGADGMAVDSQGRLYVTSNPGIQVFTPRGEYLGTIAVPKKPSNLAFAGVDRRTLYITAQDSLFRLAMKAQGPEGRGK